MIMNRREELEDNLRTAKISLELTECRVYEHSQEVRRIEQKIKDLVSEPLRTLTKALEDSGTKVYHSNDITFNINDKVFNIVVKNTPNRTHDDNVGLELWLRQNREWSVWNIYLSSVPNGTSLDPGDYIHIVFRSEL